MGTGALVSRPLAGLAIQVTTPEKAARWVCRVAIAASGEPIDVHLTNAYTVALADRDPAFRAMLAAAAANFPDGKPLAWLTRFSKQPLTQVRGPDLFVNVMDVGRQYGVKHFLLGTTEETLALLQSELEARYPGVEIAGTFSPPFRPLSEQEQHEQDERIRRSGAHITWVGLGTPKQDYEAHRIAHTLPGVAVAVGAAFDFVSGSKREAPSWVTRAGLEWAFRFASEPRRLWRRYLIGNVVFLKAVVSSRGRS